LQSIQPTAERLALGEYDRLHHFIAAGIWDARPVETKPLVQALRHFGSAPSSNDFELLRPRDGCVIHFEKCVFGRKVPRLQFLVDVLNSKWMRVERVGRDFDAVGLVRHQG
jgi:hypothetical protein